MRPNIWKELSKVSGDIIRKLKGTGILLNSISKNKEKTNTMTIGWGTLGCLWNKPVFIAFVRPQRFSYKLLEETNEFTVNISLNNHEDAIMFAGTTSGKDKDKFKEMNLTLNDSEYVSVPGIKEFDIILECKTIYKDDLKPENVPQSVKKTFYPKNDYHRFYIGEILGVRL